MGASSSSVLSRRSTPASKRNLNDLEKYYVAKRSKNLTLSIDYLFDGYDIAKKGYLSPSEAMSFCLDVMTVSGLSELIREQVVKAQLRMSSIQWDKYLMDFVVVILQEVDPKVSPRFTKEQFDVVLQKDWGPTIKESIAQGQDDRIFQRRLRESKYLGFESDNPGVTISSSVKESPSERKSTKKKKVSINHSEQSSPAPTQQPTKKSQKLKITNNEEDHTEIAEIDAIWEEHIQEEEREQKLYRSETKALTISGINAMRSSSIENISEILRIKTHVVQDLLNKFNWDKDKLLFEYFSDTEAFLKKHHLTEDKISDISQSESTFTSSSNSISTSVAPVSLSPVAPSGTDTDTTPTATTPVPENFECSICFDDVPLSKTTKLEACQHIFCNDCWAVNLNMQISTGHTLDITCMQKGCTEIVPPNIVQKLVSEEMCVKYDNFLGKKFVENSKDIIWCPSAGCERALSEPEREGKTRVLTCHCGTRICWSCRGEAHPPVSCDLVKKFTDSAGDDPELQFLVKNNLDSATLKWMHENTKECPFCNVSVQKNDGCYCMTCSNCSKQWCWLCREPWDTHPDHFRCAKYNADRDQLKNAPAHQNEDTFKKRMALQEIAKYFKYYNEQTQNIALDESTENKEKDKDKIKYLLTENSSLDTSFVLQGRLAIKKARETLKYSYVHTYFIRDQKEDALLGYLQENLEMCIEKLAQSLQKPGPSINPPEVRKGISVVLNANENLLSHVCDHETSEKKKKKWY